MNEINHEQDGRKERNNNTSRKDTKIEQIGHRK
jgi:hypothetical protein